MSVEVAKIMSRPRIPASRLIFPTEHGSWAFLFEPLIAGCAIAYSTAAPWIMVMAVGAFFARQPLKTFFITKSGTEVSAAATRFAVFFGTVSLTGLVASLWSAGPMILYPAAVAAPLAVQQFYFDISRKGRTLRAELAGAVAISSSVAMIGAAGGLGWPIALGIWAVFIARFIPSILYVRNRLLLEKGKQFDKSRPILAHTTAFVIVVLLASAGFASILTAAMFAFLLGRSIVGLSERRSKMKAMKIGVWEVVYGVLTLFSIIVGYYAGI